MSRCQPYAESDDNLVGCNENFVTLWIAAYIQ